MGRWLSCRVGHIMHMFLRYEESIKWLAKHVENKYIQKEETIVINSQNINKK